MSEKSIILIGGPSSGKSNFLARLWVALNSKKHYLTTPSSPDDLQYIEGITEHIFHGKFVPRTEPQEKNRNFEVLIESTDTTINAKVLVPDMYGEIWSKAVQTLEISEKWMSMLENSEAAALFVRIRSENNVQPLDWVTSQAHLKAGFKNTGAAEIPTQVSLIEQLRFINSNIKRGKGKLPKVAIIVTAWDLLHKDEAEEGPEQYLMRQFPMFAGRLSDVNTLNIKIFGCSIVGGDLDIPEFVTTFLNEEIEKSGYVIMKNSDDTYSETKDITQPINWLLS